MECKHGHNHTVVDDVDFCNKNFKKSSGSKYGNKKTDCKQQHTHDSKAEADYCNELKLREKARDIKGYRTQVEYVLLPPFQYDGSAVRPIKYFADFVVVHKGGLQEIVDVKGSAKAMSDTFKLKWKMLKYKCKGAKNLKCTLVERYKKDV